MLQGALELSFNYSLSVITWSAGFLVFLGAFAADPSDSGFTKFLVYAAIGSFFLSIPFGVLVLSSIIGEMTGPEATLIAIPSFVTTCAAVQFVFFVFGISFWISAAIKKGRLV